MHGKDNEEQRQVRQLRVEAEVTKTYNIQLDIGQSAALQKPLHEMLQRSTEVLKAWLKEVDKATRVEQQRKRNAAESINIIRRYCMKR